MRDLLAWALATELVGLAVLPLLRVVFGNRRDAALLSRPVGLAMLAWGGWAFSLLTSFGFSRPALLLVLLVGGAASWLLLPRLVPPAGDGDARRGPVYGDPEKLGAALFWIPAAVFILIRAAGPAIDGQEKFMDLAFLNSLARFNGMPPADPWMAGRTINYYYWGYLLAAVQAKVSNVAPMVAYNLAIASFAGFSFCSAACLGLRLSRGDLRAGLGGAFGAVFAGNLTGALDAWNAPFARDFDYFHASRVIAAGNTINEFPSSRSSTPTCIRTCSRSPTSSPPSRWRIAGWNAAPPGGSGEARRGSSPSPSSSGRRTPRASGTSPRSRSSSSCAARYARPAASGCRLSAARSEARRSAAC
jgi:hypothetical protein